MHSHPTTNGQPSVSPQDVFSHQTPHSSSSRNPSPQPTNTVHHQGHDYSPVESLPKLLTDTPKSKAGHGFPANWVEQLQLAMAIANPELLQQLVLHCQLPLVAPHQLGAISATVSVPVDGTQAADSVLKMEVISCQLSQNSPQSCHPSPSEQADSITANTKAGVAWNSLSAGIGHQRALVNQICRETKLQTLGMNIPLPEAIALLQYATFSLPDIQRILNLPYNGWHRSWWSMVDPKVDQTAPSPVTAPRGFTIPFKRLIRSRRYADGTVMLQYKDQFAHIPPPCFRTQQKSVLVHIQRPDQSIAETLAWMHHARITLQTDYGLLLYHQLSPLEHQALINQGIYLYHCASPEADEVSLPSPQTIHTGGLANCHICNQQGCPMHGQENSPVTACRFFSV